MFLFSEKIGVVGSELVQHSCNHSWVSAGENIVYIGGEILKALGSQGVGKTADNQLLFFAQVNSIMLLNITVQPLKIAVCKVQHMIEILLSVGC